MIAKYSSLLISIGFLALGYGDNRPDRYQINSDFSNFKPDGSDLPLLSNNSLASLKSWEALLIAKFLPAQPSNLSHSALARAVGKAFGVEGKDDIDLLRYNHERYIIKFRYKIDSTRAYYRQPFVIYDSLVIFNEWDGEENVEDIVLDRFNGWVQMHVDKPHLFTPEVAKEFFNEVGYSVDLPGQKSFFFKFGKARSYLRISSEVPLITLIARKYTGIGANRSSGIIIGNIKFEKIKVVCFVCGFLDHSLDDCPLSYSPENSWKSSDTLTVSNSLWGDWIFAHNWFEQDGNSGLVNSVQNEYINLKFVKKFDRESEQNPQKSCPNDPKGEMEFSDGEPAWFTLFDQKDA